MVKGEAQQAALRKKQAPGHEALGILEQDLKKRLFLVDDRYSIADIALYSHVHRAEVAGFSLAHYPATRDWLARVAAQPLHIPVDRHPD
ncbi:MAG: glutathione binding-like protein [Prochlorothrix sp.]|nr:glutathione binding-like protein [Prochlorothrix sp.]